MVFRYVAPDRLNAAVMGTSWSIYAEGVIDENTPKLAEQLIDQLQIPPWSVVCLNSPGGNLFAGMELGRVFRKHRYQLLHRCRHPFGPQGLGYSSRFLSERLHAGISGGQVSVSTPRLELRRPPLLFDASGSRSIGTGDALAVGQIFSAAILTYIREMGVDPELLNETTRAGEAEINILPRPRLEELGVVNNGAGKTVWTIESRGNGDRPMDKCVRKNSHRACELSGGIWDEGTSTCAAKQ